jgi:anti-sigma28 factor (negative regulator of flagellin synthesis)
LSGRDKAKVSESAYRVSKLCSLLNEVPDIRADIVTRLKKDIDTGKYEVPIEALADNIISKLNFDE